MKFLVTQICSVDSFRQKKLTQKGIKTKSIEAGQKVLINTNTFFFKCIENTQYKYFLKVLKIQIVLNTKGLVTVTQATGKTSKLCFKILA